MKTIFSKWLMAILLVTFFSMSQLWSAYPDKFFTLMIAYGPGGATDFQARIVTMTAGNKDLLAQPMVIINKPGAGGRVGWNWFASKAKKDGYELASYNMPHFIAQSIKFKTKYNIRNLEPIANWGADPAVLIVPKDSKLDTIKKFVAYAKKNPKKITVSGAGLFVGHHIAALQLEKAAGIKLAYVPNPKGGAAALQSVMGGQVMAGFNNLSDAYRSKDQLKIIGIADLQRNEEFLPEVPTFKENGIGVDDTSVNFRGIMVRKGTSKARIKYLAEKIPEMYTHKRSVKQMKATGSPIRVIKRDQLIKTWKKQEKYLKKLLKNL